MPSSASAFRLFHSHYHQLFHRCHHASSHSSVSVADPNCLAGKKSLLHRLFTCQAKERATEAQQQSASSSPLLPFYLHAGNAVRVGATRSFHARGSAEEQEYGSGAQGAEQRQRSSQGCSAGSVQHRPLLSLALPHRSPGRMMLLLRNDDQRSQPRCQSGHQEQSAEEDEEEDDDFHQHEHDFAFHPKHGRSFPYLPMHDLASCDHLDSDDCSRLGTGSRLIITAASPLYQHLLAFCSGITSLSPAAFRPSVSLSRSLSSPLLLSSDCTRSAFGGDLGEEKNNDHIPLPSAFTFTSSAIPSPLPVPSADEVLTVCELGASYTGRLSADGQEGEGVMLYASGDVYSGAWQAGQHHGYGVMEYRARAAEGGEVGRYSGSFVRGERDGQGVYESQDGCRYEGQWKAGQREGQGREWRSGRLLYDGEWKDNERHGFGVAFFAAGGQYQGQWQCGLQHGYGYITFSNGETWQGQWEDGERMTGETETGTEGEVRLQAADGQATASGRASELSSLLGFSKADSVVVSSASPAELHELLSQVVTLQSQLQSTLSRVEQLLWTPAALTISRSEQTAMVSAA